MTDSEKRDENKVIDDGVGGEPESEGSVGGENSEGHFTEGEPTEVMPEQNPLQDDSSAGAASDAEALLEDALFLSPDDEGGEVLEFESEGESVANDEEAGRVGELERALGEREEELSEIRQQLETVREEKEETHSRMLRVAADLENYRRRAEREKEELKRYGIDRVVSELIPALDNMERALMHAQERESDTLDASLAEGIEMVYRQIVAALKKYGVEGFESLGQPFDPQRHEAIQQVETTEEDSGTIMEEYQKGYFLHDRLLRPALVVVAKRIEPPQDGEISQAEKAEDPSALRDPEGEEDSVTKSAELDQESEAPPETE